MGEERTMSRLPNDRSGGSGDGYQTLPSLCVICSAKKVKKAGRKGRDVERNNKTEEDGRFLLPASSETCGEGGGTVRTAVAD